MSDYYLSHVISELESALLNEPVSTPNIGGKGGEKRRSARMKKGEYPYIPYDLSSFITSLQNAKGLLDPNKAHPKFLDVGCGLGTKLLLANRLGFAAFGIEKDRHYVKVAKHLVGKSCGVECRDALTFDYKGFDVIYFYCPLCQKNLQVALEARIIETASPGTLFIPKLYQNDNLWEDATKVRPVFFTRDYRGNIFQKVGAK